MKQNHCNKTKTFAFKYILIKLRTLAFKLKWMYTVILLPKTRVLKFIHYRNLEVRNISWVPEYFCCSYHVPYRRVWFMLLPCQIKVIFHDHDIALDLSIYAIQYYIGIYNIDLILHSATCCVQFMMKLKDYTFSIWKM